MTKEMLFLIDVYTDWGKSQKLPRMSADDLYMVLILKVN